MDRINLSLYIEGISLENMEKERKEYFMQQLDILQKQNPIFHGEILINANHINIYEKFIKIAFFIRNATPRALSIGNIPVSILSDKGELISLRAFRLEQPIKVQGFSASPYKIEILKSEYKDINHSIGAITVDARLGLKFTNNIVNISPN